MFQPNFKSKFLKKEKKLTKNKPKLKETVNKTVISILQNPCNPTLKTHKVKDINGQTAFSSKVTGDIRIIWDYNKQEIAIIDLLDIGGHEGKNKVYK